MMKIGTDIAHAAIRLKEGRLVAMPTETVYGLAANALDAGAIEKIYKAKGRPSNNPLITHIYSMQQARQYGVFNEAAQLLAQHFWPGPLTLVLPRTAHCALAKQLSAGLPTVALRMPAHPIARELLELCGLPLAAPSANRSGHVTATHHEHVAADFSQLDDIYVIKAGSAPIGLESTVIKCDESGVTLLRPGNISAEQIERVLGCCLAMRLDDDISPHSPGMLSSHYAPKASVRLNAADVKAGEALLAFGVPLNHAGPMLNLSESACLTEACGHLFSHLRALDASGGSCIAVMPIPQEGLGIAINDRLRRAAAPKV